LREDHDATGPVGEALEHLNCRIGPPVRLPGADTDPGIDPSTGSPLHLGQAPPPV